MGEKHIPLVTNSRTNQRPRPLLLIPLIPSQPQAPRLPIKLKRIPCLPMRLERFIIRIDTDHVHLNLLAHFVGISCVRIADGATIGVVFYVYGGGDQEGGVEVAVVVFPLRHLGVDSKEASAAAEAAGGLQPVAGEGVGGEGALEASLLRLGDCEGVDWGKEVDEDG